MDNKKCNSNSESNIEESQSAPNIKDMSEVMKTKRRRNFFFIIMKVKLV